MSSKIKYQGRVYILESEVDEKIKEKVIEKAEQAIDQVFEEGDGGGTELPVEDQPFEGVAESAEYEAEINSAISAIEGALGITIDETGRMLLSTTIGDILATSNAPTEEVPPTDGNVPMEAGAPEMVLHEGRLFRKVGTMSDYLKRPLKESTEKAFPKAIRVKGEVFVLAESQDSSKITRK